MSNEIDDIQPEQHNSSDAQLSPQQQGQRLKELALVFFKLGTIAF
ncbi:MAG: chromate transporter, partial [Moorea sp. SIO2C4]|nr:chromate transporter [Moorena sp. SIO2C4]